MYVLPEPRHILAAIDDLHQHFSILYAISKDPPAEAERALFRRVHLGVADLLGLLQLAAEHHKLDSTPLLEVRTSWETLWRNHPEPSDSIHNLPSVIPEAWLLQRLQPTTGRLRTIALEALVRSPAPADQELRRFAQVLRAWADEGLDRENAIELLGHRAITACNLGGFALRALAPLREAIVADGRDGDGQVVGHAVLEWTESAGFEVDNGPGPTFLNSVADAFDDLAKWAARGALTSKLVFGPGNTVTLESVSYPLTDRQCEILQDLAVAAGGWVTRKQLKVDPSSSERPDRIIKELPQALQDMIQSRKNCGYRLLVE